jgi:hypothetical protein
LDKTRDAFNRATIGRTIFENDIRSQDQLRQAAKLAEERDHWSRQYDGAGAELAGALQANEQISLELQARTREASDLAPALAEQGCQREQAELALARQKSLNVQLANDLEGRTAEFADADVELARERSQSESLKATLAATESKLADELTRAQRTQSEQASIASKLRQKAAEADAWTENAGLKVLALEVKTAHLERDGERRDRETAAFAIPSISS